MISGFRGEKDILLNWGFLLFLPWDNVGSHSHVGKDFVWGCGRVAGRAVCRVCQCPRSAGSAGAQSGRARRLPRAGRRSHSLPSARAEPALVPEQWSEQDRPPAGAALCPLERTIPSRPPRRKGNNYVLLNNRKFSQHCNGCETKYKPLYFLFLAIGAELHLHLCAGNCLWSRRGRVAFPKSVLNNCCSPLWNPICCLQQLLLAGWTR